MINIFKTGFFVLFLLYVLIVEGEAKSQEIHACKVAHAPSIYEKSVEFSDDVKIMIADYKKRWRKLCSDSSSIDITEIISITQKLEKHFEPVLARVVSGYRESSYPAQEKYLRQAIPKFIPGFRVSLEEYLYFNFDLAAFKELYRKGTDEDILFFETYFDVRGIKNLQKWYMQTWDFGGCVLFGEYDWLSAIKKLEIAKKIKNVVYKEKLDEIDMRLNQTFSNRKYFCTCDDKSAVASDLKKMIRGLKKSKIRPKFAQLLSQVVLDIDGGKIAINSLQDGDFCGG